MPSPQDDQLQAISEAMDALSDPEWVKANPKEAKGLRDAVRFFKSNNPQLAPGMLPGLGAVNVEGEPLLDLPRGPEKPAPREPEKRKVGAASQVGAGALGFIEGATGVTRENSVGPREEASMDSGATGQGSRSGPDIAPELKGTQWEQNLQAAEDAIREQELADFDKQTRFARIAGNVGGIAMGAPAGAARLATASTRPVQGLGILGKLAPEIAGGAASGATVGAATADTPEEFATDVALGGAGSLVGPAAKGLRGRVMPSKMRPIVADIEAAGGKLGNATMRVLPGRSASVPFGHGQEAADAFNELAKLPMSSAVGGGILGHVGGMVSPHITPTVGVIYGLLRNPEALSARGIAALTTLSKANNVTGAQLAAAIEGLDDSDKAAIDRMLSAASDVVVPPAGAAEPGRWQVETGQAVKHTLGTPGRVITEEIYAREPGFREGASAALEAAGIPLTPGATWRPR
jgi:hypothetical protein